MPKTASARGKNSALAKIAPGVAVVAVRNGCSEQNATPITGSPAILGQVEFRSYASGAFTTYHLLISNGGRLDYMDSATTTAVFDSGAATPFSSGDYRPDYAIANNCAFLCNGQSSNNKKAYIETGSRKVRAWGITRPTVGTMAGAAGAAGSHNGTYELRVTFRNSRTGVESSASNTATAAVVVANQQIDWSDIPVSADAQVDQRRLYVRNTATQALFFLAGTVNNNSATTATTNVADTALVVRAPSTTENDPPPTAHACAWHVSRMFVVGPDAPTTFYYSQLGNPEAFDLDNNFELVNPIDGQSLTALESFGGVLVLFKQGSTWLLIGDDPNSWEIRLLSADVGCTSPQSIVQIEGKLYWWSNQGPMMWDGTSNQVRNIGREQLTGVSDTLTFAASEYNDVCAVVDQARQRVLFAVAAFATTRNTEILPYNYALEAWDADTWQMIDVASWGVVQDSASVPRVYIGSYSGQVFKFWESEGDGTPSSLTTTGGSVTSATSTTLVDSTQSFPTSGNGLLDRYVYALDSTRRTVQRRRISSNTATELTLTSAWTTIPTSSYTYVVGGIDFQFDMAGEDFGQAFMRKRLREVFIESLVNTATECDIDFFVDGAQSIATTRRFSLTAGGAVYGVSIYGAATYGGGTRDTLKSRVAIVGRTFKIRVRHLKNGRDFRLIKMGLTAEQLNDRLGRGDGGTVIS